MANLVRAGQVPSTAPLAARQGIARAVIKVLLLLTAQLPLLRASPISYDTINTLADEELKKPNDPTLWIYLSVAGALVLLGGAFAGLTIALMGQVGFYTALRP